MPKVRERSRITQDFAVTPWQNRREGNKRDPPGALYVVEEAPLLVPSVTASCAPTVPCGGAVIAAPEEDVDTTGWFTKAPRQHPPDPMPTFDSEMTAIPPVSVSDDNSKGACGIGNAIALGGTDRGGPGWTGLCQLAITPTGLGMGHIFLPNRGLGCGGVSRGARCYGLALRPVPRGVPADPCTEDESTDLLCARLTDFASGAITDVLVARTGGDMCRLAPPEDWLLRQWFGDDFESDMEDDGGAGLNVNRDKWEEEDEVGEWEEVTEGEEDDREEDGNEEEGERGEVDTGEAKELGAAVVCQGRDLTEGLPSTNTVVNPHNTAHWMRLWRRQREVRSALALNFEPEMLLSGVAALPKLAEFARPLLPPQLAGVAGAGDHGGGGADSSGTEKCGSFAAEGFAAVGTDQALQSCLQGMHLGDGAGSRGHGGLEMQASAGPQAGGVMEMDVEAVVCLGPATLRGLPWT